jgi:hypothetical protein
MLMASVFHSRASGDAMSAKKPASKSSKKPESKSSKGSATKSGRKPAVEPAKVAAKQAPDVYQFRISLEEVEPVIWRRIQLSQRSTFWDLHVAIQNAMGWTDTHLHEFRVLDPKTEDEVRIGIPDVESLGEDSLTLPGWEVPVSRYLTPANPGADYLYDFGDSWQHEVLLEGTEPSTRGISYPRCIDGERACPPEDCGGPPGYEEILQAILDPDHEEHEDTLDWVGADYDPALFEPEKVRFDDPRRRWRVAFEGAEDVLDEEAIEAEEELESAKLLRGAIRKAVSQQLRGSDPPETRATFERLLAAGTSREEAWRLVSCVLATEMFEIARQQREYDHERFVAMLDALPKLPVD